MDFVFENRPSDSPFVETIWRTHSEHPGTFTSQAASHWEMVITKLKGRTTLTVRGPETHATRAESPAEAEFLGIVFKLGAFMPHLPPGAVRDRRDATLPEATGQSFWLLGMAWPLPDYDNADTFVDRLAREGLLVRDPLVDAVLNDQPQALSPRSVQRRFLHATGLTQGSLRQIERAHRAVALLEQDVPILDTVFAAGYSDQPHLTRSLNRFIGQTPAQIARQAQPE